MRPINLIPAEERRSHGDTRTGPLAYVLVGGLAVVLIGIVMLVLTSNQISDRKDELTTLESERAAAVAKVESLAPYTSFQALTEQRTATIAELADARFDWVRVIRELSRILPPDVYLTSLTGSAGGGTEGSSAAVAGPALTIDGCASGQAMVAGFVASLKDIDGVTRVGLNNSTVAEEGSGAAGGGACERPGAAQFDIVVAFDEAPPSVDGGESAIASPEEAAAESGESTEEASKSESGSEEGESGSSEGSETSETEASASAAEPNAAG